jgi:hypothetical protein
MRVPPREMSQSSAPMSFSRKVVHLRDAIERPSLAAPLQMGPIERSDHAKHVDTARSGGAAQGRG